ncbi:MAG: hypothetical protein INR73_28510, partial [Williamsia sp.]|nr:hypothetical protein [Williamsia sp.]
MIRCYLDDQPVQSPSGLDGLTFKKSRHRSFWGWTYRQLGYVDGQGGALTFRETATVDYLKSCYKKAGVQTQTSFRVVDDSQGTLYDGWINYAQRSAGPDFFSVSLRDDAVLTGLESGAVTQQSILPTEQLILSARQLDGAANLTLSADFATVTR